MYRYDDFDQRLLDERVAQFRDQTQRHLAGALSADEFRPLRLQNGLYSLRQATMLRVAIPYGLLSSGQLRRLARIARAHRLGAGHFTTRQNIQFNGPPLTDVPAILAALAEVQLHSIQTSGSCIRNITSDTFAGVAADELVDPRPWCEILRQWSRLHPEFAYLPRKFKIAITGAREDRALIRGHDLGLELRRDAAGEIGFRVFVGGGLGRTPSLAQELADFVHWPHILGYCEAILRIYNLHGRRDNPYKARLKILVKALGIAEFRRLVDAEWATIKDGPLTLTEAELTRIKDRFADPVYESLPATDAGHLWYLARDRAFACWARRNVHAHKQSGYAIVTLSTKRPGTAPGDVTAEQMDQIAQWADDYSFGEVRVSHEQNLVLPHVRQADLHALWQQAREAGLATPNRGLLTDIIACPGGEYCDLARAETSPLANAIQARFADLETLHGIGEIALNISGCVNGCGHHNVGHIGLRGVEKHDAAHYQFTLGGDQGHSAQLGEVLGPSFAAAEVPEIIDRLIATYLSHRRAGERFIDNVRRLGVEPFRQDVYGDQRAPRQVAHG